MRYRRLGRTALQVSELCLGTMNFGPETPEVESRAIMDRALELGINFFDTANRYGGSKGAGATEEIVDHRLDLPRPGRYRPRGLRLVTEIGGRSATNSYGARARSGATGRFLRTP